MLIFLIPTAKEMQDNITPITNSDNKSNQDIISALSELSITDLEHLYHVNTTIAKKEKQHITQLKNNEALSYPALHLFNGLMYRQFNQSPFLEENAAFISKHIYITSSLYGIISALTPISKHRLDFNIQLKINGKSLKTYWRKYYDAFLQENITYISLLSSEFETVFSPKFQKEFIRLKFLEDRNGQLKSHSTISKKARGAFLNEIIHQKCQTLSELRQLTFDQFTYSTKLSTENKIVFVKSINIYSYI